MGLAAAAMLAFWVRFNILDHQPRRVSGELPFTMESALHFRRIRQVAETGRVTAHDPKIFYPQGIDVWETYTVLDEFPYAWAARVLPPWMPLAERVRLVQIAWFCTGVLALGAWVALWSRSRSAGLCAAAWYAVMAPAVLRSSGIELSRENGAFPFMLAFLAFDAAARRSRDAPWFAAAAGLCAALALCAWDLTQFLIALWLIREVWIVVRRRGRSVPRDCWRTGAVTLGLLMAGLAHPYLRSHAFPISPVMGALYSLFLYHCLSRYSRLPMGRRAAAALIPLGATLLPGRILAAPYGHFAGLLWAKIRFLNIKPADPGMLTFDQRIMWVPALHSANFGIIKMLFIYTLPLTILLTGGMVAAQVRSERKDPVLHQLLFFFVITFLTFVFFVRFYVFAAVFMAALLGWAVVPRTRLGTVWPWITAALLAVGWTGETVRVFAGAERWGRNNVFYEESEHLTEWLETHMPDEPVCANFGISGSILTYAGCPIVLHPKFERADIRLRVRQYAEALYRGDERDFRAFMSDVDCLVYVHSMGSFARRRPEWQMRYFVDALETSTNAPAWNFEYRPGRLRYFERVYANRKYAVYRMLSEDDERAAAERAGESAAAFERGDLATAEARALAALKRDGKNERAIELIRMIDALKEKGFSYESKAAEP